MLKLYCLLKTWAHQQTAGLSSTCQQAEVKDHLASLGGTFVQRSTLLIIQFIVCFLA